VTQLRKKFPELPVAIVTHGKEQFALTTKNADSKTHSLVKDLVSDQIEVHVCGTHASWYNVMPEDFPDYVNVSATGPAQINDYEELGYELIVLTD
jgi:intracellular sulfur oxidation DsrE/DsrF family protein